MKNTWTPWMAFLLVGLVSACGGQDETMPEAAAEAPAEESMAESEDMPMEMDGLMNPNLAGEEELAALPGFSAEVAAAIVAGRPYLSPTELNSALMEQGMDEASLEEVYAHLWVPINLNTASQEEILLIPGVGDRMLHEFEEYRPFEDMARFNREMAKYVDDAEVERLASYVFLPIDLNTATDEEILALPGIGDRMLREFKEYRPYSDMEQFRREMGKYVDESEVARMERYVMIGGM